MKTVQLFRINSPLKLHVFASRKSAQHHCDFYPRMAGEIEEFTGQFFETGDVITVELHRGGIDNEDGLHLGGGWIKSGGIVEVTDELGGFPTGSIVDQNGKHIQSMSMVAGLTGFPYRNAQLAK